MKRFLSVVLMTVMLASLASCSSGNADTEPTAATSAAADEMPAGALKALTDEGVLQTHIEYDIPTVIGVMRDIVGKTSFLPAPNYDELPKVARNISEYILDNDLKTAEPMCAKAVGYKMVKFDSAAYGDGSFIVLDDANQTYYFFGFPQNEKCYVLMKGGYGDFKSRFFADNKAFVKSAVKKYTVLKDTNEILFCTCGYPLDGESIEAVYGADGDMLVCRCEKDGKEIIYGGGFAEITPAQADSLIGELTEEINQKYGITVSVY